MQVPLGPRQEELLSYLQGLAPAGHVFEFRRGEAAADLGFHADGVMYEALRKLVRKGFVERLHLGQSGMNGRLKVLRRLEAVRKTPAGAARKSRQVRCEKRSVLSNVADLVVANNAGA